MNVRESMKKVIEMEGQSILNFSKQLDDTFVQAFELLKSCKGKVIVTGVGKSGHIGKKIAATLASTGTPTFFIHSTEALHGDLGMIEKEDVVIMLSNSGNTAEVCGMYPSINKIGAKVISITSNKESKIAKFSDVTIIYEYEIEADHLNLAPTTSSTMTLVIGDALAVALSKAKDFKKENFHLYHPGGSLGDMLDK